MFLVEVWKKRYSVPKCEAIVGQTCAQSSLMKSGKILMRTKALGKEGETGRNFPFFFLSSLDAARTRVKLPINQEKRLGTSLIVACASVAS